MMTFHGCLNGINKQEKEEKNGMSIVEQQDQNSLTSLAEVALSNDDKKPCEDSNGSDEEKEAKFSSLWELLIRPSHKPNSGSHSASPASSSNSQNSVTPNNSVSNSLAGSNGGSMGTTTSNSTTATAGAISAAPPSGKGEKRKRMDMLDKLIASVIKRNVQKEDSSPSAPTPVVKPPVELKHFIRRYNWLEKSGQALPIRIMTLTESKSLYPGVPHSWLCDGKLLRLHDPNCENNYRIFQDQWKRGQPVIVSEVSQHLDMTLWHPDSFARDFGEDKNDLINCVTGNLVPNQPMWKFWEGFEHCSRRLKDGRGNPMLLKLNDWPPGEDFAEMLPSRFSDLMRVLPLAEYTHRTGRLNLASQLPDWGTKMYIAYGSALYPNKGTTNLHIDITDAVNVLVYVGIDKDGDTKELVKEALRAIDEAGCDILMRRRIREKRELPGALWHIYNAQDADKIRDLLNKVSLEKGACLEPHHDPIHDQSWYLDGPLRERLYVEYGVEGYPIVQCLGDSVFIPAGAPHQVRNLHNCIKVAQNFVSPENAPHCFHLKQELQQLSDTHSNHEDKLQIKNIIYHAVKDSLSVLTKFASGREEHLTNLNSTAASVPGDRTTNGSNLVGEGASASGSNNDADDETNSTSPANAEMSKVKKEPMA